ncbi:hypothetical protein [Marinobacter sp. JSM 1782161]|uniref:DUF7282 domain-containing protein n=1 Tax=Marinobacter sp. JSM 1782161 TaxID=2685906 RepID=UPI0014026731|nr:hypothetical protein [Marinobacter sp. JSM 1782161]
MKKHLMCSAFLMATLGATPALAMDNMKMGVWADNQDVAAGTVTAKKVTTDTNGWLVVHRTDEGGKPGPVVGHAPLKKGKNMDVAAILTEDVSAGDHLMLMIHGEDGGMKTGHFEYTLGAKEDGPVRMDGDLVMTVIMAE